MGQFMRWEHITVLPLGPYVPAETRVFADAGKRHFYRRRAWDVFTVSAS